VRKDLIIILINKTIKYWVEEPDSVVPVLNNFTGMGQRLSVMKAAAYRSFTETNEIIALCTGINHKIDPVHTNKFAMKLLEG
jgi:hypothetical protein